jgi:hypothetical protein
MKVNNVAPTITAGNIVLKNHTGAGNLTLTVEEGEQTGFYAEIIVSDDNSCENSVGGDEITDALIHAYRSGIGQANCDDDGEDNANNCYANAEQGTSGSCVQDTGINTCTGSADPTVGWKCTFPMQYHVDPTVAATQYPGDNWLVSVKAQDDPPESEWSTLVETNTGRELDIFLAYDVDSGGGSTTIAYGSLDPGETSADQTNTVEATGNVGLDITLYGTNMTSGGSSIAVAWQRYAPNDIIWNNRVALLVSPGAEFELNVKKTTVTATPASADIHWKLKIPPAQTAGIYSGTDTIAGKTSEPAQWSWDYRKKLTINQDSAQSSTLDNFPLLVKIASSDTNFWSHIRNDGYDVLFVDADDSTFLDFHFEKFDHTNDDMVAWVEVPEIAAYGTTDYIYLYYGNSDADTDPQDEEGTYDDDTHFKMVQHLEETSKTGGTHNDHLDSTSNDNDGEAEMEEAHMDATGEKNGADDFDGTDDRVDCGNDLGLSSTALTVEAWVKYDSWGVKTKSRAYVSDWNTWSEGSQKGFLLRTYEDVKLAQFNVGDGTNYHTVHYWTDLNLGEWYYIVGVFQANTTFKIYVNGAESSGTAPSQYVAETATPVYIGYSAINTGWFDGILDEVRISNTPRSTQWIKASYLNQKESSTYITYGWWNDSWDYRKELTINQDSAQSSTLDNFPLLVEIASFDTDFWSHVRTDGYDVRFIDGDDSTELDFHFEKFDHSTDDMIAWVEVPEIAAYDGTGYPIYLYYGNSGADTDPQDEEGTYDTDTHFKMVQHLEETSKTGGTYNDHLDSTSNNNDGEAEMEEAHMDATGRIDGADDFDGTDDKISFSNGNPIGTAENGFTVEAWIYETSGSSKQITYLETIQLRDSIFYTRVDGNWQGLSFSQPSLNQWHHIIGTFNGTHMKVYIDGQFIDEKYVAGDIENASNFRIGGRSNNNLEQFNGIIDEVRISDTARPLQWIKASCLNQKEHSTYISYGPEESP